ncbi:hypothetical protein IFU39_00375 [Paenibacillus sp. CFBP 13594]|uniref:beta barrel domain-containing protein n=1 Tax=Paenibacillus sp. CFBP 13594 TaxID=2774037 RepID=UPI001782BB9E|nr:hypothetical protein [Paenibacillus sp. CFBP 13594]MBD8836274.1 hypothetical protein [Paenibacillus sp. CFBP 13594]
MNQTRTELEIGQSLWINSSSFYKTEPGVDEYIIEKINKTSVYVMRKGGSYLLRLDRKTLTASEMPFFYKAYLSGSQYWLTVERAKQKEELLKSLSSRLKLMSLKELQEFKEQVDNLSVKV